MPSADPVIGQDIDPQEGPAEDFSPQEFTEIVAKAASIAKAQGKLPSSVAGMIKEATEPQYPVYMLLENFVDSATRDDDMSWKRPHRDFMSRGVIMPSAYSDKVSHVVLCYDTSGSVPDEDLTRFHRVGGDIIRRLRPQKLTVMQVDASLKEEFIIEVEHDRDWPTEIKSSGRGGTSFKPPFDYLQKKNIVPSCLVYLTDMYGDFPDRPPIYPTLWISTTKDTKGPFGQTVYFNG
jgi:predicted metal-dependent peptidase